MGFTKVDAFVAALGSCVSRTTTLLSSALCLGLCWGAFGCSEVHVSDAEATTAPIARPRIHLHGDATQSPPRYAKLEEVLDLAEDEWTVFDPYRGEEVRGRGLTLQRLVERWGVPETERVTMTSLSGYRATFFRKEWEQDRILFITHEGDHPLGRDRLGPARVMILSPDATRRRAQSSRWVWQIQEIEFSTQTTIGRAPDSAAR